MSGNSFKDRLAATMDAAGIRQSDLVRMAAEKGAKLGKSQVSQYVSGKVTPVATSWRSLPICCGSTPPGSRESRPTTPRRALAAFPPPVQCLPRELAGRA